MVQETPSRIPTTDIEAEKHIREITRSTRANGNPSLHEEQLAAALTLLWRLPSHQPLRFIYELLRNADDSIYTSTSPSMWITVEKGEDNTTTIRFDTNQKGFTRSDVEALCTIGCTTKESGFKVKMIGERGASFMAVFQVADVVWVHSNHYSFKFDARQPLGMLAPVLAQFPRDTLPSCTSILVQLRPEIDAERLIEDIKSLESRVLIFLRQIKQINIKILQQGQPDWSQILVRRDNPQPALDFRIITLDPDDSYPYAVFHYQATNLPSDPRRPGLTESEIRIAFPKSRARTYNVYAFLPIRDYGFKFLLHADFVLTNSRDDIDSSSAWNQALVKQIPRAFLAAIRQFNQTTEMKYSWLSYIPISSPQADFFHGMRRELLRVISQEPLLETVTGSFGTPSGLVRYPLYFSKWDGTPMIPSGSWNAKGSLAISSRYDHDDTETLKHLGVRTSSAEDFLDDLAQYIARKPFEFRARSVRWHCRLAEILCSILPSFRERISNLPIIPLKDGRWISPGRGPLVTTSFSQRLLVPGGIPLFQVSPEMEVDLYRQELLKLFDVSKVDESYVCDIITKTHRNISAPSQDMSLDDLVSQLRFLYISDWEAKRTGLPERFWFISQDGSYHRGQALYLQSDVKLSASRIFEHRLNLKYKVQFLHNLYTKTLDDLPGYEVWLEENFGIARLPRLVSFSSDGPQLHDDFRFVLDNISPNTILELIAYHSGHYLSLLQRSQSVRSILSATQVRCRGGVMAILESTYLPRRAVLEDLDILDQALKVKPTRPLLDIPDPEDENWDFLGLLGVTLKLNATQYIMRLQSLQANEPVDPELVSKLYQRIETSISDEEVAFNRRLLINSQLIFIPLQSGMWFTANECVWTGPDCLVKTLCLERYYPEHKKLFVDYLGVKEGPSLDTIIAEVQKITIHDSLQYIHELLTTVNDMLGQATRAERKRARGQLKNCKIWPVTTIGSRINYPTEQPYDFDYLMDSQEVWFIPDDQHLHHMFIGSLPFLALDPTFLSGPYSLIPPSKVQARLISRIPGLGMQVKCEEKKLVPYYSNRLRTKAKYLSRLIPLSNPSRDDIAAKLRHVKVYQAHDISVTWTVRLSDERLIHGRKENRRVALGRDKDGIRIYLDPEDCNPRCPPLELEEELSIFLGIEDPYHNRFVFHILVQEDMQRIKRDLDRRGLPTPPHSATQEPDFMPLNDQDDHEGGSSLSSVEVLRDETERPVSFQSQRGSMSGSPTGRANPRFSGPPMLTVPLLSSLRGMG